MAATALPSSTAGVQPAQGPLPAESSTTGVQPAQGPLPAPSYTAGLQPAEGPLPAPSSTTGVQPAQGPLPAPSAIASSSRASSPSSRSGLPAPHAAAVLWGPAMSRACERPGLRKLVTSWVLKPNYHGMPPDDVRLDVGSNRRDGTGLWGWLWGPWQFCPTPRGYVHVSMKLLGVITWLFRFLSWYHNQFLTTSTHGPQGDQWLRFGPRKAGCTSHSGFCPAAGGCQLAYSGSGEPLSCLVVELLTS